MNRDRFIYKNHQIITNFDVKTNLNTKTALKYYKNHIN